MLNRVKYQIRNPDHIIEELILLGMITQTEFLHRIVPRIDLEFFKSPEIRIIAHWILNYHSAHNKAPGSEIETICQVETRHDKTLQREKLENLLTIVLNQIDDSFNTEYVLKKALEFFKRRSLVITTENIQHFLDKDDIEEAELSYYKYREVVQSIQQNPNPLGNEALQSWWEHTDEELMRFPGYLGKYLSPICRSQLLGVLGPPKRGKTTTLTEFACIGLMHKLKVVFFSLEMSRDKINQRIVTRLAGRPKITEAHKEFVLPVMDCELNQTGKCKRSYRKSSIDLLGDDDVIMPYSVHLDGKYIPCSTCLGKSDSYKFAVWYETKMFTKTPMKYFEKTLKDFRGIFGDNLRVEAYPTGTFSIQDLKNRLTLLEQEENFIPDIICIPEGSLVLTQNSGMISIEKIKKSDRVWDGHTWVGHEGVVYKGIREIIEYAGITATPNHLFWTEDGWRSLESCKRLGLRIAQTEHNGKNLRVGKSYISNSKSSHKKENQKGTKTILLLCIHKMYSVWKRKMDITWKFAERWRLSYLFAAKEISPVALLPCTGNGSKMHKPKPYRLEILWPERNQIQLPKYFRSLLMDIRKFRATKKQKTRVGPDNQRWPLRARKSEVVHKKAELPAHNSPHDNSKDLSVQTAISTCKIFRRNNEEILKRDDTKRGSKQVEQVPKQKSRVWDIKNAGPFHCFTVQGVLAHNCVDSADNLKKQDRDRRIEIGRIWEQLIALSQERNCLVVTASQTNRAAVNKPDLTMEDLAEDFSKAMGCDLFLAVNQTSHEKDQQILRMSVILHRHRGFSLHHQCRILQAPEIGQFCLGSCAAHRKLSR